ncbi:MAG: adenylate cyclase regulatory domain-containing protein [Actinomycetota bacterium]
MQGELTANELAELLGSNPEEVEALRQAGLIDPHGDGRFDDLDLVRAQIVKEYLDEGYDPETLAGAIKEAKVVPFLADLIFDQGPRYSVEDAATKAEVKPEQIRELRTALGLSGEWLRERDLDLLDAFRTFESAGFEWEAIIEGARVFGDSLRRLADTEARLVHVNIHERLIAEGLPEREVSRQVFSLQDSVAPLLDPLILHIHRDHLLRAMIEDAYVHLLGASDSETMGSVDAAVAFIDIASFTEMTQEKGDRHVGELIDRLQGVVRHHALEHGGKLVKEIGDAFMLSFRDPVESVRFARAILNSVTHDADMPKIRIGINCGSVMFHSGDYTGPL